MGQIAFVTGGSRSGKSTFAERMAAESGASVCYIATLEPLDDEMRDRVTRHRAQRPADWTTVEATRDLPGALRAQPPDACVLIDCLSVWVSNRLLTLGEEPGAAALAELERTLDAEVAALLDAARAHGGSTIIVSNEVGSGLVPPYPLGRAYRDLLGRANQRVSLAADRAWLVVAGRALELPAP